MIDYIKFWFAKTLADALISVGILAFVIFLCFATEIIEWSRYMLAGSRRSKEGKR